jgi:uncharacterized protein
MSDVHTHSERPEFGELSLKIPCPSGPPIPTILTTPPATSNTAVILCHGFLSDKHSRTNRRLTDLLVPEGIATLRFDWYGMGELREHFFHLSLSRCLDQLTTLLAFLQAQEFHSIGMVGSSFGGFMAILAAARFPILKALGLKCPVLDFPESLRLEFGEQAMMQWQKHHVIPNILGGQDPIPLQYTFYEECFHEDAYASAGRISIPTQVVHGGHDTLIPRHQIDKLMKILNGPKQLHILPDADHQFGRPEDFRVMTTLLAHWMIDHLLDRPQEQENVIL